MTAPHLHLPPWQTRCMGKFVGRRMADAAALEWLPGKSGTLPDCAAVRASAVHFVQGTLQHEALYVLEMVRATARRRIGRSNREASLAIAELEEGRTLDPADGVGAAIEKLTTSGRPLSERQQVLETENKLGIGGRST